jgi:hypothetical protein
MKTRLWPLASLAVLSLTIGCKKSQNSPTTGTNGTTPPADTTVAAGSPVSDYGTFTIQSAASSKWIEVSGQVTQGTQLLDGATLQQDNLSVTNSKTDRWQEWQFCKQSNGYYTIMNLNSGKYIDVPGSTTTSGTTLDQYRGNNTDAQYWAVTLVNGNYKITNKANGLAITDHGNSKSDDAPITQETYTGAKDQVWVLNALPVDSYRDDAVVGFFQRTSGSEAFDGGASTPLTWSTNAGKVFWQTNDVFYNQLLPNGEFTCGQIFNYHNSGLIQPASHSWDPTQTVNILSSDGVQIFHDPTQGALFWPGACTEVGQHIYVHNIEVPAGSLVADAQYLCDITESTTTTIPAVNNLTVPNMSNQTNITYSIGMVQPRDGYVYAYGQGGFLGASIFVARFPTSSPTDWTFWDGSTWAATPSTASAAVIATGPINNNTVGYINGKYVLITMDFGFSCDQTSRNMYAATATSPTGPFTTQKIVYSLADYKQGHTPVFYNPTIHAEFNDGHSELLVDYCVNFYSKNDGTGATCLAPCSNPDGTEDPNDYRPKGVRIPFSLIGL